MKRVASILSMAFTGAALAAPGLEQRDHTLTYNVTIYDQPGWTGKQIFAEVTFVEPDLEGICAIGRFDSFGDEKPKSISFGEENSGINCRFYNGTDCEGSGKAWFMSTNYTLLDEEEMKDVASLGCNYRNH